MFYAETKAKDAPKGQQVISPARPLQRTAAQQILQMQKLMGNRAVLQMMKAQMQPKSEPLQMKQDVAQMAWHYGNVHELIGDRGTIHYHYSFDDANIDSLHITFADHQNYNARTWAIRTYYAPLGRAAGAWGALQRNFGRPPGWVWDHADANLAGAQQDGLQAFRANQNITALINQRYPQQAPNINNPIDFPDL